MSAIPPFSVFFEADILFGYDEKFRYLCKSRKKRRREKERKREKSKNAKTRKGEKAKRAGKRKERQREKNDNTDMANEHGGKTATHEKPAWLKIRLHRDETFAEVERVVRSRSLHTICSSGRCPNKAECWSRRTATFMILGDVCTRSCRFCATASGRPSGTDAAEPEKVAESIALMGLRHAVITSVTRDDLPDGGAEHWAATVEAVRRRNPHTTIEVLIPDMDGRTELLDTVIASQPDIAGHNIETVERLTPDVRSRAEYRRSLAVLAYLSSRGLRTKSGLMVGLGESEEEVMQTLHDLRAAGVGIVTIGQYLQPTSRHWPVAEYVEPERFEHYRRAAMDMGFDYCASAPLVRSSYLAEEALRQARGGDGVRETEK